MKRPNDTDVVMREPNPDEDDEVLSSLPQIVLVEQWPAFDDDDATPLLPVPPSLRAPVTQRTPSLQMLVGPSSVSPISLPAVSSGRFRARSGAPSWGWYFSGILAALLATVCLRFDEPPLRSREPAIRPLPLHVDAPVRHLAAAPAVNEPAKPAVATPSGIDFELDTLGAAPKPAVAPTLAITTACEELARSAFAARIDGDLDAATGLYARALHANPAYFPAAIGLADTQWERGQQEAARISYRDIVAAFPAPMVPERARARGAQAP